LKKIKIQKKRIANWGEEKIDAEPTLRKDGSDSVGCRKRFAKKSPRNEVSVKQGIEDC